MVFLTAHVQLDIQQGIGMYLIETLQQRNMKLSVWPGPASTLPESNNLEDLHFVLICFSLYGNKQ